MMYDSTRPRISCVLYAFLMLVFGELRPGTGFSAWVAWRSGRG